jgi:hypothetical protein
MGKTHHKGAKDTKLKTLKINEQSHYHLVDVGYLFVVSSWNRSRSTPSPGPGIRSRISRRGV